MKPSKSTRKLGKAATKPTKMVGKTLITRLAGFRPGMVPASATALLVGGGVAVVTYRLVRSH